MIDPVEALISLALTDAGLAALVGDRISLRHKFGAGQGDWPLGSKALTFRWDSGNADPYIEVQTPRIEARCYGESFYEAGKVYQALVAWSRSVDRLQVETANGMALVYYALMDSAPGMFIDPDLGAETLLVFMEAAVAEPATA